MLALVGLAAGLLAASAWAGSDLLTPTGVIAQNGLQGPRHSLTSVDGTSQNPNGLACVTALDNPSGSQAGTADCEPKGTLALHYYNGSLRNGLIYPQPNVSIAGSGYQNW